MIKTPAQWRKEWAYTKNRLRWIKNNVMGDTIDLQCAMRKTQDDCLLGYARARGWWWLYS